MKLHRCTHPHDRTRSDSLRPILPSQYQLRTHSQSSNTTDTRPTNSPPTNNSMMIPRHARQPSITPSTQPNSRANSPYRTMQLISMDNPIYRGRCPNYRSLLPLYVPVDTTRSPTSPYQIPRPLTLSRTLSYRTPLNPCYTSNLQTRTNLNLTDL